jgi:anaerobic C4-dicarboxylate transporter
MSYEVPLLEQGKHPDSDPQFWSNYKEPAFPKYGENPYWKEGMDRADLAFKLFLAAIVVVPILIVALVVWRRRRKLQTLPQDISE